jgi:hypothetical protein
LCLSFAGSRRRRRFQNEPATIGAGFAHAAGDPVAKPIDHSHGVVKFCLDDVYRPLLGG